MRSINLYQKNGFTLLLLTVSLFLGTVVRTLDLSDARFRFPDEYSSTRLYYKYPMLRMVYKPFMSLFDNPAGQTEAIYTSAIFGILTLLLVFALGKKLFNETVGSYSAVILAISGYHTFFSRTAYAATLQTFFLLLGGWLFIVSFKKHRLWYLLATGIVSGCAFTTYAVSYAPIAVFYLLLVFVQSCRQTDIKRIFINLLTLSAGILIPILFVEFYADFFHSKSYISILMSNQKDTALYAPRSLKAPLVFFDTISDLGGSWQLLLALAGFFYTLISGIREKKGNLLLLAGFVSGCYLFFSGMALLGIHSIRPRKYLYLIPFVSLCSGYLFYGLEKKISRYWALALLAVFVGLSFPRCITISEKTFKIKPMTVWLKQQGIGKSQIITGFDLYEKGDTERAYWLPAEYRESKYQERVMLWKKLYHKKRVKYLITSEIGSKTSIGSIDPVFRKRIEPVNTWTLPGHPEVLVLYSLKDLLAAVDTDR